MFLGKVIGTLVATQKEASLDGLKFLVVRRLTIETFRVCGGLDIARVAFRLDTENDLQPMILEINALPGLAYNSDLTLCAQADGWSHYDLLQAYFNTAVQRYGLAAPAAQAVAA